MAAFVRNVRRRLFQKPLELPRTTRTVATTPGFKLLNNSKMIEEERVPEFEARPFYPVRLGEVFGSKYQVVSKLGWGGNATVWLCRDLVYVMNVSLNEQIPAHKNGKY